MCMLEVLDLNRLDVVFSTLSSRHASPAFTCMHELHIAQEVHPVPADTHEARTYPTC